MVKNESKVVSTLKLFGEDMMAPVMAHCNNGNKIKRKSSMVEQLARRVIKKASFLANSKRSSQNANQSVSNSKINLYFTFRLPPIYLLHLGMMRFDAVGKDSTTNISRNKVSFIMAEDLSQPYPEDHNDFVNMSSVLTNKMTDISNSKVLLSVWKFD